MILSPSNINKNRNPLNSFNTWEMRHTFGLSFSVRMRSTSMLKIRIDWYSRYWTDFKNRLLTKFGSVKRIQEAEELNYQSLAKLQLQGFAHFAQKPTAFRRHHAVNVELDGKRVNFYPDPLKNHRPDLPFQSPIKIRSLFLNIDFQYTKFSKWD